LALAGIIAVCILPIFAAADEITPPQLVATSYQDGATLGIPRWKGYMSEENPDQFWLSYANQGSAENNVKYTTDGGVTWSSNVIQVDATGWLDYHLALFGKGGELFFSWPGVSSTLFRKFNAPAHSNDDRGPISSMAGTTVWHRSSVMVQDNGRIWVFTRISDQARENVRYHYSDNNGASWTSAMAYETNYPLVRIGSMPYVDGRPALIVLYMDSNRGYEYYLWNGSSFEARADYNIYPGNMNQVRTFTHNVINDTTMHLIFGLGQELHHVWKHYNNGTGSWNHQIIDNAPYVNINDWFPISTVRGDDLYLFYCKKSTSAEGTSMIYYKKWSQVTQNWTSPILVSTDPANTYNRDANTCFHVPLTSNYVPVFWRCGSGPYSIYFSKILVESGPVDTIPPGQINDLGPFSTPE
jgi:hypothetical protein